VNHFVQNNIFLKKIIVLKYEHFFSNIINYFITDNDGVYFYNKKMKYSNFL